MIVTRSIHIEAPLERVFALVTDPAARARLSPDSTPIRVEIEHGGALRAGSVCHYRVQTGGRILDYRMRVVEFEPPHLVAAASDTAVPFETRIELTPENGGTRLIHSERLEPSDAMLERALPEGTPRSLTRAVYRLFLFEAAWSEALRLRERQEQALARTLGAKLERWLAAIKRHLETG